MNCRIVVDGDWVREVKNEVGRWNGDKFVVLSLFDGIGGVWVVFICLGIFFLGYSFEVVSILVFVFLNFFILIGFIIE